MHHVGIFVEHAVMLTWGCRAGALHLGNVGDEVGVALVLLLGSCF